MKKIALITPLLQPYRISFYEKLSKADPNIDFTIFHGVNPKEKGRPSYKGETNFPNIGFKELEYFIPIKIVYNIGLLNAIKKYNPDVVILQPIPGDISNRLVSNWAVRNNKKLIMWTCGFEPHRVGGTLLKLKNRVVSSLYKKADKHLTYSYNARDYAFNMGVPYSKSVVTYNGIEIDHLLADEERIIRRGKEIKNSFKLNNHITFIYAGGLIPEKRVDLLIEAFISLRRHHRDIKLLIIGDGPQKSELMRMATDKNIRFLGRIIDDVDPYFAAADSLVLPGIGGLALNQAMFWGKPCIVSEADGTEDDLVIDDKTGFRFKKDDLKSLEDAMRRMLQLNNDDYDAMSKLSKMIICNKSNVNSMVDVFMIEIKDLLRQYLFTCGNIND